MPEWAAATPMMDMERAISAAFVARLAKPVNADELFALIQHVTSHNSDDKHSA